MSAMHTKVKLLFPKEILFIFRVKAEEGYILPSHLFPLEIDKKWYSNISFSDRFILFSKSLMNLKLRFNSQNK